MSEPPLDRGQFLGLALVFQGSLVVLACLLGWIARINPLEHVVWSWTAIAWGTGAALPILAVFHFSDWFHARSIVTEVLGPLLASCRWIDLVWLALLAGVSEELLFRGVLQPWIDRLGEPAGLIGSNLIFGAAHLITPMYAVVAALVGVYLGLLMSVEGGEPNLVVPVVTHAVYDFLAFLIVVRDYRSHESTPRTGMGNSTPDAANPPESADPTDAQG